MILVIGDIDDPNASYLAWVAEQRGEEVVGLDESRFGLDWTVDRTDGSGTAVVVHGRRIEVRDVDGVISCLGGDPAVEPAVCIPRDLRGFYAGERRRTIEALIGDVRCTVVNDPTARPPRPSVTSPATQTSQWAQLEAAGFQVPEFLVTADARSAAAFAHRHGDNVVVTSTPGHRRFVGWWDDDIAEGLVSRQGAVGLQQFVAGEDVRVHVVGDTVFATAVESDPFGDLTEVDDAMYRAVEAPAIIKQLCLIFARCEGLSLAAFHFKVTLDGTWWCHRMEANPSFLRFEVGSGQAIGDAVVDLVAVPALSSTISALAEPMRVMTPRPTMTALLGGVGLVPA